MASPACPGNVNALFVFSHHPYSYVKHVCPRMDVLPSTRVKDNACIDSVYQVGISCKYVMF